MKTFSMFSVRGLSMKRKLFGYMFTLTTLLIVLLIIGLSLFGQFSSPIKDTKESLDIQMEVYSKEVLSHFDRLAAASILLSEDVYGIIEEALEENGIEFSALTDSPDKLNGIQQSIIPVLRQKMLQEQCSGAFVFLEATVNSKIEGSESSKSGVYLQVNGYESTDDSVILYRGNSELGKANGMMLHRQWHLEFDANSFPDYEKIVSLAALPTDNAYYITELHTIPNTSDRAMLMVVPITDADGTFLGACGFEISSNYFMSHHSQPTKIDHLLCMLSSGTGNVIDTANTVSSGVSGGYYRAPSGKLEVKAFDEGLSRLNGESDYIGLCRAVALTPNNGEYTFTVMMPKADYDRELGKSIVQNIILWLLLIFFAVGCCRFFSKHYLAPILKGLEELKSPKREDVGSDIPEINDLFIYLADQDKRHELEVSELEDKMLEAREDAHRLYREFERARSEYELAKDKYDGAQREIERLAYSRKTEVDPDDYQVFLAGIDTLTPTEKKVFEYYLSGKTVKEIIELSAIKESTLRFHNKNIYSKLGVNSLKQLLRYAAMNRADENSEN